MDKERKKKLRTWRLILTESLMFITIVVLVIILIFVAMGYKLSGDGSINQTGLVQINSIPTGAVVTIDGEEMFARTNMNRMLSEDKHKIVLTKDGYEMWEKEIEVQAGILYQLDYPRLFKQNRESEIVKDFSKRLWFVSASPTQTRILLAEPGATVWQLISLRGDEPNIAELDVSPYFRLGDDQNTEDVSEFSGEIVGMSWSGDGNRVLVEWKNADRHDWVLLNVRDMKKSVNLTEVFGLDFQDVKLASDSADRLLVLENGNLHKVSVSSKELSGVLVNGVDNFSNLEMDVVYVSKDNDKKIVGLYRDGIDNVVKITTFSDTESVKTTTNEYLGRKYIGIAQDQNLLIYRGDYPNSEQKLSDTMEKIVETRLERVPDTLHSHDEGRFIVAKNGTQFAVFNAELAEVNQYTVENGYTFWLDEFLLANIDDGNLVVRDFDGTNRRTLAQASSGYDAVISANNKWFYYITNHGTQLKRERL